MQATVVREDKPDAMAQVATVRGPIDTAALETTLMHEHVFVISEEIRQNYPGYWDEKHRVEDAAKQLTELTTRGVRTIVDPTVIGLGRYLPRVAEVNALVDINIVVATGLYTFNDVPFFFHYHGPGTMLGGEEPMVELFTRDLTTGVADTGIRAAFLKCAIDAPGLTPGVERVMRAVAKTHVATGAPITVHTNVHNQSGLEAQRIFKEEGVAMDKVVIGHSGDSTDFDYLERLIDGGSILGMDRFGIQALLPTPQRVATVAELCRRGYAERLVLSQDAACFMDWFAEGELAAGAPTWNFTHIHDDVIPALRAEGVTDAQLDTMLVRNPRRYFE